MAPTADVGRPSVLAKGIERIELKRKLSGARRLDVGPFYALYTLIVAMAGYYASRFEW